MRPRMMVLLCASLLLGAASATAQPYTLKQCIEVGLRQNTDVLRATGNVDRANANKRQAFGVFLPSVSASGSWSRYDRDQIGFRGDNLFKSRNSFQYSIRSGLVLFDGLSNFNNARRGILAEQAAQYGYDRQEQTLVYSIQSAFYNAMRTRQLVKVNETNLDRSRRQLDRIRELNTVGSVPMADVYRQQVQVGRDELALLQAQNEETNALLDLQRVIGVTPNAMFALDTRDVPTTIDSAAVADYRASLADAPTLVRHALDTRLDVRQADLNLQAADKGVSVAFAGHLPSVTAFAQYNWNNLELAGFSEYDRSVYGLSLEVPLFSGFQVDAAVQRAKVDRQDASYQKSDIERTITSDVHKALNTLSTAEKNIEISRRILVSAQEDFRIASERYSLGAGTQLDQIVAASNLTSAESDAINASFNYLIARDQLAFQLGQSSK